MLTVAQSLAAKGFVVAAIDAPYHGDRAFCAQSSDCSADGTAAGADGVCTPDQARAGQGDAVPPGTCTTGTLRPSDNLSTIASGNYFISGNFFRIRDALRQGLIDQSALVLALARPPVGLPLPEQNPLETELAGLGVAVDPTRVYYEGQSLGGIQGTALSATNPRVSRAVLAVPGGTLTDIFTTAPAFDAEVDALFLSLGIDRNLIPVDDAVAARYLQTLIVAKWILDPADPINYAAHVGEKIAEPDLVAALGPLASATTSGFGQLSRCDQVVPNATTVVDGSPLAYGDLLLDLAGVPTTLYSSDAAVDNCVPHGVLADTFSTPSIGLSVRDQAAQFLSDLSVPTAQVTLP
jgi:pimeloyl-ACP methyl ester carboxylesterase